MSMGVMSDEIIVHPLVLTEDQLDAGLHQGQYQLAAVDNTLSVDGDSQLLNQAAQLLSLTKIGEPLHVELMTDTGVSETDVGSNVQQQGSVGSIVNKVNLLP
jgi:hypothetical protein